MDLDMVSGQNATFEFQLTDATGQPFDISTQTVEMLISKGSSKTWHVKKVSAPGSHFDASASKVRFTITAADAPPKNTIQTWWYEIWRVTGGTPQLKPHIVGEIKLLSTNRI
jgi:hypothetical protein